MVWFLNTTFRSATPVFGFLLKIARVERHLALRNACGTYLGHSRYVWERKNGFYHFHPFLYLPGGPAHTFYLGFQKGDFEGLQEGLFWPPIWKSRAQAPISTSWIGLKIFLGDPEIMKFAQKNLQRDSCSTFGFWGPEISKTPTPKRAHLGLFRAGSWR